jgi:hypothetical protein
VEGVSNAYNKIKSMITGQEIQNSKTEERNYYVPPPNRDFSSTGDISRLGESINWTDKKSDRKKGEVSGSWFSENSEKKELPKEKFKFDYNFQSNFDFLNEKSETNNSSSDPLSDPSNQNNSSTQGNDEALEFFF